MKPAKAFLVTVLLSFVAAAQLNRNDVLWIGSPWSREEIIRMMGFVPLTKPFRSAYQYQNIMFTAAGESVAAVSGGAWEAFIQRNIFDALGMNGANFRKVDAQRAPDHSAVHQLTKGKMQTGSCGQLYGPPIHADFQASWNAATFWPNTWSVSQSAAQLPWAS